MLLTARRRHQLVLQEALRLATVEERRYGYRGRRCGYLMRPLLLQRRSRRALEQEVLAAVAAALPFPAAALRTPRTAWNDSV